MKAIAMAHPHHHHALSSVKKWGGKVTAYLPLHDYFDQSKSHMADFRHRAFRHHSLGIFQLDERFGRTITLSSGRVIPTRGVCEQQVKEDLGLIPALADWLRCIRPEPWMSRSKRLSRELQQEDAEIHAHIADLSTQTAPADENDIVLKRAKAMVEHYATQTLRPPDTTPQGIAGIIADLLYLAAREGSDDSAILSIIKLAETATPPRTAGSPRFRRGWFIDSDTTGDISMNQPSNVSSIFAALRHRMREIAWSILELHHRLFGPDIHPSRLPETLNGDNHKPAGPLGPSD